MELDITKNITEFRACVHADSLILGGPDSSQILIEKNINILKRREEEKRQYNRREEKTREEKREEDKRKDREEN